jgi:hypothetical protein
VVEPVHVRRAPLVALRVDPCLVGGVLADDGPALACRHLLVRVERERGAVASRPDERGVLVDGADRLASILDDPQPARAGQGLEALHVRGPAEDVHRQKARRVLPHSGLGCRRRDVQRRRVDVDEHRFGVLIEQAVGRRHEAERGRDHLVAGPDPRGTDRQVKR